MDEGAAMTLDEARTILCDMLVEDDQGVEQLREMPSTAWTPAEVEAIAVWRAERAKDIGIPG